MSNSEHITNLKDKIIKYTHILYTDVHTDPSRRLAQSFMNNGAIEAWGQESSHKHTAHRPQQDRAEQEHKLPHTLQ